jgi:hypothetical protein
MRLSSFCRITAALILGAMALPAHTQYATLTGKFRAANGSSNATPQSVEGAVTDKGGQVFNVKAYGALCNGSTDDSSAIQSTLTLAGQSASLTKSASVFVPPGLCVVASQLVIPPSVNIEGPGELKWTATAGAVPFIQVVGSNHRITEITIDANRFGNPAGSAAIDFANAGCMSGGQNVAGGLQLSSSVTAGATSLTVTSPTCGPSSVQPLDYITLYNGANRETVQVAQSYTVGTGTIPLQGATQYAYTAASSQVTLAETNINVHDLTVYGSGFDGISFWHVIGGDISNNEIYSCVDTCIDLPDGGDQQFTILGNAVSTNGRYGIAIDGSNDAFGIAQNITVSGNAITLEAGGTDTRFGIDINHVNDLTVTDNVVNVQGAGIAGVALFQYGHGWSFGGNTVIGSSSTTDCYYYSLAPSFANPDLISMTGNIADGCQNGFELYNAQNVALIGNTANHFSTYGFDFIVNGAYPQTATLVGNTANTTSASVAYRFATQTQSSTSTVRLWMNMDYGTYTYATYSIGDGWTVALSDAGGQLNTNGGYQARGKQIIPAASTLPYVGSSAGAAGKAACVKSVGPPVIMGYCSTQPDLTGSCTCN